MVRGSEYSVLRIGYCRLLTAYLPWRQAPALRVAEWAAGRHGNPVVASSFSGGLPGGKESVGAEPPRSTPGE